MYRYKQILIKTIVPIAWMIIIATITFMYGYYLGSRENITRAMESFDHSQCQYPNRLSNPVNGCDNSDPARPECMKSGIEDCDLPTQEPEKSYIESNIETTPVYIETEVSSKICQ